MKKIFFALLSAVMLSAACQEEAFVNLSESAKVLEYKAGTVEITVDALGSWSLEGTYDWITPSATKGVSGDKLTFAYGTNLTGSIRNASYNVVCDGATATFTISQKSGSVDAVVALNLGVMNDEKVEFLVDVATANPDDQVGDVRTPMTPFVRFRGGDTGLRWYMIEGAQRYDVYAGGQKVLETTVNKCKIEDHWSGDLQVVAVAADGTPSFPSEPLNRNEKVAKEFEPVMILGQSGKDFTIEMTIPHDGVWNLSWNYANGRGSLFSDLTCGIRMLYVDGNRSGIDIFPNRKDAGGAPGTFATDGWDLWGWTSPLKVDLKAGKHKFVLKCESDADNMSRKVNDFMLKGCRLTLDAE